jgi:hypothetical protein
MFIKAFSEWYVHDFVDSLAVVNTVKLSSGCDDRAALS